MLLFHSHCGTSIENFEKYRKLRRSIEKLNDMTLRDQQQLLRSTQLSLSDQKPILVSIIFLNIDGDTMKGIW